MIPAPIGISTYIRLNHLKQTINALRNNTLAKESILYLFSDSPRKGDEKKVFELREYLHKIKGFKKIYIVERETNDRVYNNREGQRYLLELYGKCIFLEEDIVTAPGFLQFMNEALNKYKNNEKILSITGYSLPIVIPENYSFDCYSLPRFNSWGFGIWKEKYEKIKYFNRIEFLEQKKNNKKFNTFIHACGNDVINLFLKEIDNEIDALDVKGMFCQLKNNMYTIYPVRSLVQNIGHDGSGVHCVKSEKFKHYKLWKKVSNFNLKYNIKPDKQIIEANYNFRNTGYKGKILILVKKTGVYHFLKSLGHEIK